MERKGILEDAKLGMKFRTRDGHLAIYLVDRGGYKYCHPHLLFVEGKTTTTTYRNDGRKWDDDTDSTDDIVSLWVGGLEETQKTLTDE